jgi:hypothetical protein
MEELSAHQVYLVPSSNWILEGNGKAVAAATLSDSFGNIIAAVSKKHALVDLNMLWTAFARFFGLLPIGSRITFTCPFLVVVRINSGNDPSL